MVDKPIGWPLAAEPYAVQAEAYSRGRDRKRFGYWLEQGLGKTLTLCADYATQVHQDRVNGLAILAPSYLKSGWRDEWATWGMPMPLLTWPDVPKPGDRIYRQPHGIVYNYDSILYSGGDHLEELLKSDRYMVAADESRAIGNPSGRWNKRAMYLRTHAEQLRAMCGQPWTNSIMDMFPQLRWCGGLEGWNPYAFRNHFAVMGGYQGKQVKGIKPGLEEEFQEVITSCGIRALKKDWWDDCPEKIWPAPLEIEMTRPQKEMYEEMRKDFCAAIPGEATDDDALVYAAHVGNMYQKLSQISRGFILDNEGKAKAIVDPGKNPAISVTKAAVEAITGKVIVFAFHKFSMELLEAALRDFGLVVLRGGMEDREIEQVKFQFNNDDSIRVILAQLTVGARGHTLLGTETMRCSNTLYYECIFDADLMWQSSDRNHRYGQDRAVVYNTLRASSIDDKMKLSLQHKTNMVEAVLDAVRLTR